MILVDGVNMKKFLSHNNFSKILIIGYGSMGEKYYNILKKNKKVKIYIVSKRTLNLPNIIHIKYLYKAKHINFNYIIVCSETYKHFNQIRFIEKNFEHSFVLIEKPITTKYQVLNLKKNKYYVAYNLRFLEKIQFLKKLIIKQKIFFCYICCETYLPHWKKKINYKRSYSSSVKKGGGTLLELSHELDYAKWLFKDFKITNAKINKNSKLKINAEHSAVLIGKNNSLDIYFNLNLNSKNSENRLIFLMGNKKNYYCDLLKNKFYEIRKKAIKEIRFDNDYIKNSYKRQLTSFLNHDFTNFCQYKDALSVVKLVDRARKL